MYVVHRCQHINVHTKYQNSLMHVIAIDKIQIIDSCQLWPWLGDLVSYTRHFVTWRTNLPRIFKSLRGMSELLIRQSIIVIGTFYRVTLTWRVESFMRHNVVNPRTCLSSNLKIRLCMSYWPDANYRHPLAVFLTWWPWVMCVTQLLHLVNISAK